MAEPHAAPTDAQAQAVIALCDRYLTLVGLPAYTALADAKILEVQTVARAVAGDSLNFAEAEIRRLRQAHGLIAREVRDALAALERGDIFAADSLLTEVVGTATVHARTARGALAEAANVVCLSVARQTRRARDFGGAP